MREKTDQDSLFSARFVNSANGTGFWIVLCGGGYTVHCGVFQQFWLLPTTCQQQVMTTFPFPPSHDNKSRHVANDLCVAKLLLVESHWFTDVYVCVLSCFSRVWPCVTLWTVTCQAPLSMGFSRKKYWRGGVMPSSRGSSWPTSLIFPALAGRFFTTSATCEAP